MVPPIEASLSAAPDWSRVSHEVRCPLCEYNLYGLTTPRCTECGHTFEWSVMLDPAAAQHAYLFEHHIDRPIRSYFATVFGAMLPRRFWKALRPNQCSRLGMLLAFASFNLMLFMVLFFADAYIVTLHGYWGLIRFDGFVPKGEQLGRASAIAWREIRDVRSIQPLLLILGAVVSWLPLTYLSLMIFQVSMRRAKIRSGHVIRCVAYSLDAGVWAMACLPFFVVHIAALLTDSIIEARMRNWVTAVLVVTVAFGIYRLWAAYAYYLRFDRPAATIVASQVVVLLVGLNLYCLYSYWL